MRWPVPDRVVLLAALVLLPHSAAGAEPFDPAVIDEVMKTALDAWQVPGAALVIVKDDEVICLKGFGVKELGTQRAVTPDTVFPLASCTKAFTTTAMAMLVDEGKMSWDDPVRKHLDWFRLFDPLADAQVTLRDLVTHRAGLSGHDLLWYRSPWTEEEIIRKLAYLKPSFSFRTTFHYQSAMFMAAGQAVARTSNRRWEDVIQKRIVEPLGMSSVSYTTAEAEKAKDRASPHRRNADGKVEVIPGYRFDRVNTAGSMHATARDLGQWLRFQLGDGTFGDRRLVSVQNLAETHMPQTIIRLEGPARVMNPYTTQLSYGMAWVVQDYRGRRLVSHAGSIDGFRAHITLVPDERLGIGLLHNLNGTHMNLAVSNRLLDIWFQTLEKDWNAYLGRIAALHEEMARDRQRELRRRRHPDTQPSRPLKAYVGTYEDPAYGTVRISLEGDHLVWAWSSFRCPLEHYHYDTFNVTDPSLTDHQLRFVIGLRGEPTSLNVLDIEFKRKP